MDYDDWDSLFQMVPTSSRLAQEEPVSPLPTRPRLARAVSSPQVPTPPPSGMGSLSEHQEALVPISTAFHPGANLDVHPADLLILSHDNILFYVHRHKILGASDNHFASYVPYEPNGKHVSIPLQSVVLNILLHAIYGMPVVHYFPTTDDVLAAIECTRTYGLASDVYLAQGAPLYEVAVSVASYAPFRFYALAAALDAYPLAVAVSSRLLSFPLDSITDDVAAEVGAVYLKRLFFLHLGRTAALKRLLEMPLRSHEPSLICDSNEQKKLARAWSLASAYLAWDSNAAVTPTAIQNTLLPLGNHLTCPRCSAILHERITDLVSRWSKIKDTI